MSGTEEKRTIREKLEPRSKGCVISKNLKHHNKNTKKIELIKNAT